MSRLESKSHPRRREPPEDVRGNPEPHSVAYDPGRGDNWEPWDFVAGNYLPEMPPHRDDERNAIVARALLDVLYERGHIVAEVMVRCAIDSPVYDTSSEVFDILVVLNDYDPEDIFATPERNALFASMPCSTLNDALLAEFAGDAHFCVGTGEPIEEATYFLLGEREGEGEWDEMRVSYRVAIEVGRVERARDLERMISADLDTTLDGPHDEPGEGMARARSMLPRLGRPPLPPDERRVRVNVMITRETRAGLDALAKAWGTSRGVVIDRLVAGARSREKQTDHDQWCRCRSCE